MIRISLLITWSAAASVAVGLAAAQPVPDIAHAEFADTGNAKLPIGYREWAHVGTRINPIGISILDGKMTMTPEVLNAYVEPKALAIYEKTGKWPSGTQIVKEFSAVRTGANCDAATFLCTTQFGHAIFQTGYIGLGLMVKDKARFANAPGNWGFFSFGHKPPPYEGSSPLRPYSQCAACHVRLASDTDYVITRAHIGLAGAYVP